VQRHRFEQAGLAQRASDAERTHIFAHAITVDRRDLDRSPARSPRRAPEMLVLFGRGWAGSARLQAMVLPLRGRRADRPPCSSPASPAEVKEENCAASHALGPSGTAPPVYKARGAVQHGCVAGGFHRSIPQALWLVRKRFDLSLRLFVVMRLILLSKVRTRLIISSGGAGSEAIRSREHHGCSRTFHRESGLFLQR